MNLGKSLSISESESDKYLYDFLKEEVMIFVYFSFILCSTTHHCVQLALGISQRGNPFEMGIHYQYTHIKSEILNLCQFLVLMPYNLTVIKTPLLSTQLTQPSSTHKIKELGILLQMQIELYISEKRSARA